MDLTHAVLSFAVLGALLTITPGLDSALVLRAAVSMGRGPAFATALGVGAGALAWGAAAAVGVSALLTNLLNPKVGAFYVAVLPQFIPDGSSPPAVGVLLALVHDLEGILWFSAIIVGAGALRRQLARRSVRRAVDGGTGAVLPGFGLKLGLGSR
ncbi:LysE family translocator [Actinoplanes sp. CA-142083]|uniref:LysE family translocator n=1 Tax=Actinoplanes sp. CA-142083 TaxID=3239903 RepID=UPI003D8F9554